MRQQEEAGMANPNDPFEQHKQVVLGRLRGDKVPVSKLRVSVGYFIDGPGGRRDRTARAFATLEQWQEIIRETNFH
ncbi:MAG TPA: hypothetical protein VMX18_00560 [Candidatus Bipolaricaulota bacterium]|nr:hypothetical protein [Candidatus Bipolaricaulota bacterium]